MQNNMNDMDVTIDNWKPEFREKKIIQSEWRKQQNNNDFNQSVGRDELKKIKFAIKNKYADHEIMKTYGINAETLIAVKENKINPELGIMRGKLEEDETYKLIKKVNKLQGALYGINYALKELAKILFSEKEQQQEFLKLMNKRPEKSKKKDIIEE